MRVAGSTSARAAEAKRRARRVPEDQRKRGIQSCDLCRKKRCRCIPAPGKDNRCTTCLAQNSSCTFTLPRKTRFYGNLEDLSDRFRCLEAIVRGAFPDEPTDSVADLIHLGQTRGYQMPDLSQNSETPVKIDDALRIPHQPEISVEEDFPDAPIANHPARPRAKSNPIPAAYQENLQSDDGPVSLVTDTSGKEHYIGPSGGLQFLGQLRRLLISKEHTPEMRSPPPPSAISKFTEDDGAQALEAEDVSEDSLDTKNVDDPSNAAMHHQRSPTSIASPESDFMRRSTISIEDHWRRLPAPEIVDKLLNSFFQNVHDDFVLFHRGTFEGDYEAQARRLYHNGTQPHEDKEVDLGLLACIHMMLVFGSMSDSTIGGTGLDHNMLRRQCVASARSLLPHLIGKCTLYNLRALLLLGLFLHNNNERNATWNLVGTATRVGFALGLHRRDTESAFNPIDREIRKRIFCTLYGFEQFLATSLGRPSGMNDSDVEVIPPRPGMLDGDGGGGDAVLAAFTLRLHRILGRSRVSQDAKISAEVIHESKLLTPEAALLSLGRWKADLAKHPWLNIPSIKTGESLFDDKESGAIALDEIKSPLRWQSRSSLRAALMLQLQYHYTAIFATRPFLLQELAASGQGEQESPTHRQTSLAVQCVRHATQLAMICLLLDSFGLVNGVSGLDIFYFYWAAMIMSLGMLRRHPPSEEARVLAALSGLVAQLRVAAGKVEKSGTMKRFATLFAAFADYVNYRCWPSKAAITNMNEMRGNCVPEREDHVDPNHAALGATQPVPNTFVGSGGFDPFHWSNPMVPLGHTIEGGGGLDGFAGWANGIGAVGNGVDWMGSLMTPGIDMPLEYGGPSMRHP